MGGYGLWWQWLVVGVYGGGKWVGEWVLVDGGWVPFIVVVASGGLILG